MLKLLQCLLVSVLALSTRTFAQPPTDSETVAVADSDHWTAFKRHMHGAKAGFQRHRRGISSGLSSGLSRRDNYSPGGRNESQSSSSAASTGDPGHPRYQKSSSRKLGGYWYGASSYYLYALGDSDRYAVLDALKNNGFKVVRIFIGYVGAKNKGSNNREVQDLEPNTVGAYDDTVLHLIDQLMYDCNVRGLKLLIALSDRYQLGYWGTDAYATALKIVQPGSKGVQKIANAATFYTSNWAAKALDDRIRHILAHRNELLGSTPWSELDEVIYAFEAQNEPQGHMAMASEQWACQRSATIKSLLPSGSSIQVSSGGGITIDTSLGDWATKCDSMDIVSVHDYGTNAQAAVNALKNAQQRYPDKSVIMGEWGASGARKASTTAAFVSAFKNAQIPHCVWQVVNPGAGAADFEIWTGEAAWKALIGAPFTDDPAPIASPTNVKTKSAQSKSLPTQSSSSAAAFVQSKLPEAASATKSSRLSQASPRGKATVGNRPTASSIPESLGEKAE